MAAPLEGPAVAATSGPSRCGTVICAALALPGLALPGLAEAAESDVLAGQGLVAVRMLSYRDWQPGLQRVRADSPSVQLQLPLAGRWSLDATATRDSVSGASPRWHSSISGASRMRDNRSAFDARVDHHGDRDTWSLGVATSDEHDYESRAVSAQWRHSTENNNRSWSLSASHARDRIGSSDNATLDERRRSTSLGLGLTQVLSVVDVAQLSLSVTEGRGFFSDPYKSLDSRPDHRRQTALQLRWNHHVQALNATLRGSWRYYRDSFGVRAHTVGLEWVAPVSERLAITPLLRAHTQSAASFYFDPVYGPVGEPYPPGYFSNPPTYLSADHRLSAFGALTVGLKLSAELGRHWSADLRLERYEQRGGWRVGGAGSPGLAPLKARMAQAGVVYRF